MSSLPSPSTTRTTRKPSNHRPTVIMMKKEWQSLTAFILAASIIVKHSEALKYTYADGSVYEGDVNNVGRPSGFGKLYDSSGALEYEGDFKEGLRHGNGTRYVKDGKVLRGEFRHGISDGLAQLTYSNGDRAVGDFLNVKPYGKASFMRHYLQDDQPPSTLSGESISAAKCNVNLTAPGVETDQGVPKLPREIFRIEGQFRQGMAHGRVVIWYCTPESGVAKVDGTFRMGRAHGNISFLNGDDVVVGKGRFNLGSLLDVHLYSEAEEKSIIRLLSGEIVL